MDFEVYCDESGLEALTCKEAHSYTGIGGIWIPANQRPILKSDISEVKKRHGIFGELKWQKLSPAYYDLYKDLIDFFFSADYIRFRIIVIESEKVDHMHFNDEDAELGFYKFYYQLLHHWILDFNTYNVFVDLKTNRRQGRLKELERVLNKTNLTTGIKQVQGLPSEQSVGIQLADVLTGLVVSKFNGELRSKAKLDLIKHVERIHLEKRAIDATPKWVEKFNIFKINLKGGW